VATAQGDQPDEYAGLLIRSNLPMGTLTQELKNALAEASPEIGEEFHVMQTNIRDSLAARAFDGRAFRFFGALATLLAMMGLFGVMSTSSRAAPEKSGYA